MHARRTVWSRDENGSALVLVMLIIMSLSAMAVALFTVAHANKRDVADSTESLRALYNAETGASLALFEVRTMYDFESGKIVPDATPTTQGGIQTILLPAGIGSTALYRDEGGRSVGYDVTVVAQGQNYIITSRGFVGDVEREVELVVQPPQAAQLYQKALFSGNSDGDNYTLLLGGFGGQADLVTGDVYSGGNLAVTGDAIIDGVAMAAGTITGVSGVQGVLGIPDIEAMDYENNNDVNMVDQFNAQAYSGTTVAGWGGTADQLPDDVLGHIFRRNPSDRKDHWEADKLAYGRDTYYLEDPYSKKSTNQYKITPSRPVQGDPSNPLNGNDKVIFIDGNLRLDMSGPLGYKFYFPEKTGLKLTVVVKGNIYWGDNLDYLNKNKDGLVFIAMKDTDRNNGDGTFGIADSGNIYFGDPRHGTLESMKAFMYAENNFIDQNLSAKGSLEFEIFGNMTAGNQVAINRDFEQPGTYEWVLINGVLTEVYVPGPTIHSKMTVTLDDRILTGQLDLPGLPTDTIGAGDVKFTVVSYRVKGIDESAP